MHNINALVLAWLQYLTRQLDAQRSLQHLESQLQWARDEYRQISEDPLVDRAFLNDPLNELALAIEDAEQRLHLLTQVQLFNQESDPHECRCQHQRVETGVFYNSIKALQCFSCHGWQTIRKVIQ